MIELRVAEYCQNCDKFEPDLDKQHSYGGKTFTTISCVYEKQCYDMYKYLKKEIEHKIGEDPDAGR